MLFLPPRSNPYSLAGFQLPCSRLSLVSLPASSSFRLACSFEQFTRLSSSLPTGSWLPSSFWLQPNQHCQMSCKINFLLGSFPWCQIPFPFLSNLLSHKPGSVSHNHTCHFHKDKETKTPLHSLGGKGLTKETAADTVFRFPEGSVGYALLLPGSQCHLSSPNCIPVPERRNLCNSRRADGNLGLP